MEEAEPGEMAEQYPNPNPNLVPENPPNPNPDPNREVQELKRNIEEMGEGMRAMGEQLGALMSLVASLTTKEREGGLQSPAVNHNAEAGRPRQPPPQPPVVT